MEMTQTLSFALGAAILAILAGLWLAKWILGLPQGTDKMKEIASAIQQGARAYLNRQTMTVAWIAAALFVILGLFVDWTTAIGFLVGAVLSALAGYVGMYIAVRANVRTAEAAKSGMQPALKVAVRGGAVTGLLVVVASPCSV